MVTIVVLWHFMAFYYIIGPRFEASEHRQLTPEASHLGKVNLLEQRWDPLEWHLGLGTGLTLTVGSFIGGCAAWLGMGQCMVYCKRNLYGKIR